MHQRDGHYQPASLLATRRPTPDIPKQSFKTRMESDIQTFRVAMTRMTLLGTTCRDQLGFQALLQAAHVQLPRYFHMLGSDAGSIGV